MNIIIISIMVLKNFKLSIDNIVKKVLIYNFSKMILITHPRLIMNTPFH